MGHQVPGYLVRINFRQGEPQRLGCIAKGPAAGTKLGCSRGGARLREEDTAEGSLPFLSRTQPNSCSSGGTWATGRQMGHTVLGAPEHPHGGVGGAAWWRGSVSKLEVWPDRAGWLPHQGSAVRTDSHVLQPTFMERLLRSRYRVQS